MDIFQHDRGKSHRPPGDCLQTVKYNCVVLVDESPAAKHQNQEIPSLDLILQPQSKNWTREPKPHQAKNLVATPPP